MLESQNCTISLSQMSLSGGSKRRPCTVASHHLPGLNKASFHAFFVSWLCAAGRLCSRCTVPGLVNISHGARADALFAPKRNVFSSFNLLRWIAVLTRPARLWLTVLCLFQIQIWQCWIKMSLIRWQSRPLWLLKLLFLLKRNELF